VTARRHWRRAADSGQVTVFAVLAVIALIALAGLVYDGGQAMAAKTTAIDIAQEAARAGAQQISLGALRNGGHVVLDGPAARAAALAYVASAGAGDSASVTVTADTVTVTVTRVQPTAILSVVGVRSLTVTGSATATAESGLTGPGVALSAAGPALTGRPGR
jgi:Putative Flp pilus-assembly TadE/G-like